MKKIIFLFYFVLLSTGSYCFADFGDNWQQTGFSLPYDGIWCGDNGKCLAFTTAPNLYISSDFGNTWSNIGNKGYANKVTCSSDGVKCFSAGGSNGQKIGVSNNGGNTWVDKGPNYTWSSISCSSDGVKCVAVNTSGGRPHTTVDSGNTWVANVSTPAGTWRDVSCSSDGVKCVGVVENAYIYISSDSGNTWSPKSVIKQWESVSCSSDGVKCVAVNKDGSIYVSTDSGNNWISKNPPGFTTGSSVSCSSDGVKCVALITSLGYIYVSTDSGNNWNNYGSNLSYKNVSCSNNGMLCIVSTVGTGYLYKYYSTGISPLTSTIDGLTCQTDWIPSLSGATWYNFGGLPNMQDVSDISIPDISWVNSNSDFSSYDVISWGPYGTGSSMGSGTFQYPATQTGYLYDSLNDFGILSIGSKRNGLATQYNIFQFFGTENIAFGLVGRASMLDTNGVNYKNVVLSSSGGIITGGLANTTAYIETLAIQNMSRFRGFRIGKGILEEKKACSINFNQCEWSFEGNNLACIASPTANGLQFSGNGSGCGITGSGSIYGSGACVPLVNASGSIIPPPPITGGYVTYNASGSVVGTVNPPINPNTEFGDFWNCGNDPWYKCPITIIKNFWNYTFKTADNAQNTVSQFEQATTQTMSGVQLKSTGSTYTGSNTLLQAISSVDTRVGQDKSVNTFKWVSIFVALFFSILGISLLLKS